MRDEHYKLIVDVARKRGATFPTNADWLEFKAAIDAAVAASQAQVVVEVTARTTTGLKNPPACFDYLRKNKPLGPGLSTSEVAGTEAILTACGAAMWPMSYVAYALATAFHETAGTMQPIREYGRGRGRKYGVPGKHGQIGYGRGYVQLTWDWNYEKADNELGLGGALIRDYELALDHAIAAQIMVRGMQEGWFTKKKLADFLPARGPATRAQYVACRPIINGRDKADLIAGHAMEFQKALIAGEWA